ncbi:MAG TPA: hypothetical protein VLK56_05015 [Solirubrobacterales bacterium]|nr:hypothetical protein [Solirubrobacterales bacterium]
MLASIISGLRRVGRRRTAAAVALALAALALFGYGQGSSPRTVAEALRQNEPGSRKSNRLTHSGPTTSSIAPRSNSTPRDPPASEPDPAAEAARSDPSSMPPASAGTNGSFVPPKSAEGRPIVPHSMERLEPGAAGPSAILLGGIALAPPNAPEAIKAAITAANEIVGRPYAWGGGHTSWYSRGYDCSGAVSYALGGGGFLAAPLDSSQLESWGEPGPGRWLTVYANPGHAYAVIAGLRWDTVGDARGTGPRWHPAIAYPEGFVARHPPGY